MEKSQRSQGSEKGSSRKMNIVFKKTNDFLDKIFFFE